MVNDLRLRIDEHPLVIGWGLDGTEVWVCCESGNLILHISLYQKREAEKQYHAALLEYHNGLRPTEPVRPRPQQTIRHPVLGPSCNGLECKHVPLENVQRSHQVMQRVLETLAHHKDTSA